MLGMGAIVTGRLFDLWDGKDANKNGVKGNFGALEDATIDKINATHALLRFSTKGQINPVLAAINGGMQLANAGAALLQGKKEGGSNASNAGKKATFSLWGSTTIELAATVAGRFGHPKLAKVLTRASRSANIVSLGMNTRATGGYINKFFHIPQRRHC